jgi:hypothetical protein
MNHPLRGLSDKQRKVLRFLNGMPTKQTSTRTLWNHPPSPLVGYLEREIDVFMARLVNRGLVAHYPRLCLWEITQAGQNLIAGDHT